MYQMAFQIIVVDPEWRDMSEGFATVRGSYGNRVEHETWAQAVAWYIMYSPRPVRFSIFSDPPRTRRTKDIHTKFRHYGAAEVYKTRREESFIAGNMRRTTFLRQDYVPNKLPMIF